MILLVLSLSLITVSWLCGPRWCGIVDHLLAQVPIVSMCLLLLLDTHFEQHLLLGQELLLRCHIGVLGGGGRIGVLLGSHLLLLLVELLVLLDLLHQHYLLILGQLLVALAR